MPITTKLKLPIWLRKLSRLVQVNLSRLRFEINWSVIVLQWSLQIKKKKKNLTWNTSMIKNMAQTEQCYNIMQTVQNEGMMAEGDCKANNIHIHITTG